MPSTTFLEYVIVLLQKQPNLLERKKNSFILHDFFFFSHSARVHCLCTASTYNLSKLGVIFFASSFFFFFYSELTVLISHGHGLTVFAFFSRFMICSSMLIQNNLFLYFSLWLKRKSIFCSSFFYYILFPFLP